jgi:hypothetical protein
VAVFNLSARTAGVAGAAGDDRLVGRVPAGWYQTAVLASSDTLFVVNGKGTGTRANPVDGPRPSGGPRRAAGYTLDQIGSTLMISRTARASAATLTQLSERVARAEGWDRERTAPSYPPFKHVIYIIKDNRPRPGVRRHAVK